MMAIVFAFYLVWLVVAVVAAAPAIIVFLPVLLIPALVLPIIATHYLPMLTARAVEGLEFCLGIRTSGGAYLPSSSATKLQLEDEEKQQIGEATLDFKASVTVVLCVVVMALPVVQFYQRDQTWSEHAHDLILDTFGWEQLSLQFRLNLTWPKFNVPAISASFFLSLFVLFLTLVRVYATQLLLWCSGQPWFAMAESKPGKWEQRGLVAFASVRYVG